MHPDTHIWAVGHRDVEMRRALSKRDIKPPAPPSTTDHRLAQREKQLKMGKSTRGYDLYIKEVPRHARDPARAFSDNTDRRRHPRTPDPRSRASKRAFDGRVRAWRRALHDWDDVESPMPTQTAAASKWTLPPAAVLRRSAFWHD